MNAAQQSFLPDVQSTADQRRFVIQQVDVKSIVHPVSVQTASGIQTSVATIDSENFESVHNHSAYAVVEGPSA